MNSKAAAVEVRGVIGFMNEVNCGGACTVTQQLMVYKYRGVLQSVGFFCLVPLQHR